MKTHFRLLIGMAVLFGAACCYGQDAPASATDTAGADFQKAHVYGDKGTTEFGLSGMFGKTSLSGTEDGTDYEQSSIDGNFSLFAKYFVNKHIHVGGAFLGNISLSYDQDGTLTGGSGEAILLALAGYTFPLAPQLQLDLGGGIGGAAVYLNSWTPIFAFTYIGQPMLLIPIGESVNIGVGMNLIGISVDGTIQYADGSSTTISGLSFSTNAVLQLSVYF